MRDGAGTCQYYMCMGNVRVCVLMYMCVEGAMYMCMMYLVCTEVCAVCVCVCVCVWHGMVITWASIY